MVRKVFLLLLFAVLLCSCSCHVLHHSYNGDKQITIGTKLTQPHERMGYIADDRKACFVLFGLIPLNSVSGPKMADRCARAQFGDDYDGITRLRIVEEMNPVDVVVNMVVGIIFSMMTVEVEGEVHRFVRS